MHATNIRRVALALSLAAAIAPGVLLRAQQRPTRDQPPAPLVGTALISGMVITDDAAARPLSRAQLLVVGSDTGYLKVAETDEQGRFTLPALPAGRYLLGGTKMGYLDAAYGAKRPGRPGTQISLAEGQQLNNVVLKLTPGGVATGVITDERGQPMPNASVRLQSTDVKQAGSNASALSMAMLFAGRGGMTQTDDRGVYRLFGVTPGDYTIVVTAPNNPASDARVLSAEEIQAGLQALRDPSRPAGGQQGSVAPPPTTVISSGRGVGGFGGMDLSNPMLSSLMPGMPAQAGNGPTVGYAPVYYPGTTEAAQAATVTIKAGEERTGLDVRALLVPTARIDCQVVVPSGQPTTNLQVTLRQTGKPSMSILDLLGGQQFMPRAGTEGRYTFTGIPPGRYTLMARSYPMQGNQASAPADASAPPPPPATSQWAMTEVTVSGQNLSGIVLTLQPGLSLSGRVEFHSDKPVDLKNLQVQATVRPVQLDATNLTSQGSAFTRSDKTFTLEGLVPNKYLLGGQVILGSAVTSAGLDPSSMFRWTLESATVGGKDVADLPFDVQPNVEIKDAVLTFTDKKQEVFGTLQDATGRPAPDYTVVLFPTDKRYWLPGSRRIVTARPATDGHFEIGGEAGSLGPMMGVAGLPAGEYFLAAVTDLGPGEQYDLKLLEALAKASVKITLAPGDRKQQDLRIAGTTSEVDFRSRRSRF